jgi:hypothetical protein
MGANGASLVGHYVGINDSIGHGIKRANHGGIWFRFPGCRDLLVSGHAGKGCTAHRGEMGVLEKFDQIHTATERLSNESKGPAIKGIRVAQNSSLMLETTYNVREATSDSLDLGHANKGTSLQG